MLRPALAVILLAGLAEFKSKKGEWQQTLELWGGQEWWLGGTMVGQFYKLVLSSFLSLRPANQPHTDVCEQCILLAASQVTKRYLIGQKPNAVEQK